MEKTDAVKLLAIDDKPDILTTLSAVVRDALPRTRVLTATNGPAGIELAAAEDPDVILLDILMPGMDGFEVCRRLKADERLNDIPVVFLTALKTDPASRVKALEAGAEGFLAKPLETAELTAQIKAMAKIKAANRSQRTEAAHDLEASETRYRRLFETARDGILILDADTGKVVDVNPFMLDLLGFSYEAFVGKHLWDIGVFNDIAASQAAFRELQAKDYIRYEDLPLETRDGRRIDVEFVSNVYLVDNRKVIQCNIRDITERKRAESRTEHLTRVLRAIRDVNQLITHETDRAALLRRSCEILTSTRGYRSAWVALRDAEGRLDDVAESGISEDFGAVREALEQGEWPECHRRALEHPAGIAAIHDPRVHCKACALKHTYRDTAALAGRLRHAGRDYGALVVALPSELADDEEEQSLFRELIGDVAYALHAMDLAQARKQAEEAIHRLNAELEQRVRERTVQLEAANKELEAFSYSVSHDLRAPLRHISGYVDLLNNRFREGLPEKAGHYLDEVTDSARQMGVLIDDLLQFSRTGRQELRQADMDMNAVVQEALERLKPDTEDRHISWTVADLPRVFGDSSLLQQVWINLLENAVKYTRYKEEAKIEVGCTREPDHWAFFVRDNGVGFDMRYAHKLFGVFQRLHSAAQFEGSGIGLANVQRIVHKHGGRVRAEGRPDEGAAFYFTIPENTFRQGGRS